MATFNMQFRDQLHDCIEQGLVLFRGYVPCMEPVVALWIRLLTLNRKPHGSNPLEAAVVPLGKALSRIG